MEVFRHVVRELGETHFIYAGASLGPVGQGFGDAWGLEDWVLSLAEKPDEIREGNLKHADYVRRCGEFFKKEGADALFLGVDLGYNRGPFLSPQMHRRIYLPGFAAWVEASHSHGLPLFFHSCGNNRPLWGQFAEAGFDVYQAIQPEEDLGDLKREVSGRMSLWGGINCHKLCFVEPEEVRRDVRRNLELAAPGGGFILGASHSVMVATRYDTYMAALEVGREWRY
jgi:uroporphyrinogen decarboxylase